MGWASGLQAGIQLGNAFKQGQERRRMEEIQQATPEASQGYTAEQGAQLEAMAKAINPETGRPYYQVSAGEGGNYTVTPDFTESQRPVGLTGTPTENAPIAYDQQRVTNFLGKRYEGELAPERVEGLRTRAMAEATADPRLRQQMLMEATRAEREAQEAPLRLQSLQQGVTLGGVQLTAAQRAEKTAAANEQADVALAEMRAKGTPINSQSLAELAKSTGADYNNLLKNELNQLGFNEKTAAVEMKNLSKEWSRAALGGTASINKFLTDKFDPDKNDNVTPELVQTKNGYVVMYGDKVLSNYGTHKDLNTVIAQVHGMINDDPLGTLKSLAAIKASDASANYHNAATGLTGLKADAFKNEQAGRTEASKIAADFDALPLDKQNGPEGLALKNKFNMANAKAGGQISLGVQARPGQLMSDVEKANLAEYYKWENDDRNARLPQAEKDKKATRMGVYQFANPTANTVQSGLGSNPYGGSGVASPSAKNQTANTRQTPTIPALSSENTRILGPAGNAGFNVELLDGTTRTMSPSDLEAMGYKFPNGTGLQRPWYADLMPRR